MEEHIGRIVYDINCSMIFHDSPPKIMEIKPKINKWDLIKLIRFFTAKESINKVKRQPSGWNKVIAKETIAELLISKIWKQLIQLNSRKINKPSRKWAKDLNRHFAKEDLQMANKSMNSTHY